MLGRGTERVEAGPGSALRLSTGWPLVAMAVTMIGFVAATNKWVSWYAATHQFALTDEINYRAMANAAPGLLHHHIVEWQAERFAVQWIVGSAAKLFGISVLGAYRIGFGVVLAVICIGLVDLLARIRLSTAAAAVCLGVLLLNVYLLRPLMIGPGGLADLVFVLGTVIVVRGLVLRSPANLLVGLLIGIAARQTALLGAFVAYAAVMLDPAWAARLPRRRGIFAAGLLVTCLLGYGVIRLVAGPFSGPAPSLHTMTVLGMPLSLHVVSQHLGRCINGLLSVIALLVGAWWLRRRTLGAREGGPPGAASSQSAALACLGLGLTIVVQPLLLNPSWVSDNEPRLAVIGLVPLILAAALWLAQVQASTGRALSWPMAAALLGLLAVASLHHIYTVIGTGSNGQTVALEVFVAVAIVALLTRLDASPRTGLQASDPRTAH